MILLFGNNAKSSAKTNSLHRTNSTKNNKPVENSGILAMNLSEAKSLLTMGEYDTYISSNPVAINYALYSDFSDGSDFDSGFLSEYSSALSCFTDGGFSGDCGFSSDCGSSCSSSFASVC